MWYHKKILWTIKTPLLLYINILMHTWRSYHNHAKKFKPQYCSETKSYYHKTIHKSKYLHNHNQIHFSLQAQTSCATCQIFVHNHTMILSLTRVPHCYTQPFMQWACRIFNCIKFTTLGWNIKTRRTSSTIESIIISIHFSFGAYQKNNGISYDQNFVGHMSFEVIVTCN